MTTIACHSCGRTQTLRRHKVIACDQYACSPTCTVTGEHWSLPKKEGFHFLELMNAAGGFYGLQYKPNSQEDIDAFDRAQKILEMGTHQSELDGILAEKNIGRL